jgi:hypothetical protein
MRIAVGILCSAAWILYIGQAISVLNFRKAQRLGLQESQDHTDPVHRRLESWAARWDLLWLWTLPVAGILMLIDHAWWPWAAMIGGGAFVDTGGREAAKVIGLRREGVRIGSPGQRRLATATYAYLISTGLMAIVIGLLEIA